MWFSHDFLFHFFDIYKIFFIHHLVRSGAFIYAIMHRLCFSNGTNGDVFIDSRSNVMRAWNVDRNIYRNRFRGRCATAQIEKKPLRGTSRSVILVVVLKKKKYIKKKRKERKTFFRFAQCSTYRSSATPRNEAISFNRTLFDQFAYWSNPKISLHFSFKSLRWTRNLSVVYFFSSKWLFHFEWVLFFLIFLLLIQLRFFLHLIHRNSVPPNQFGCFNGEL